MKTSGAAHGCFPVPHQGSVGFLALFAHFTMRYRNKRTYGAC